MNPLQEYAVNSIFARNHMSEDDFKRALDELPSELIDRFITSVIHSKDSDSNTKKPKEYKPVYSKITLHSYNNDRICVLKTICKVFGKTIQKSKEIVDMLDNNKSYTSSSLFNHLLIVNADIETIEKAIQTLQEVNIQCELK